MNRFTTYIKAHKIRAGLALFAVLLIGYFVFFKGAKTSTQYALATVQQGTIVSSISGTGQVSASNQVDIKPKVSGTVTYVTPLIPGTKVAAGTLLAQIDSTDAAKAVRSAQLDLQSAQLALVKLQNTQANGTISSSDSMTNDQSDLVKAYQDGFNNVATTFVHFPTYENDARLVLYGTQLLSQTGCQPDACAYGNLAAAGTQRDQINILVQNAKDDYAKASISYNTSLNEYRTTSHSDDSAKINTMIQDTLTATQDLSQAMKSESTLLSTLVGYIQQDINRTVPSAITTYQSTLSSDLGNVNSQVSTLLSSQNSITTSTQAIASDQRNASTSTQSDSIDIQNQQNVIAQRQAALLDAQITLGDYSIRAPFAGILAAVSVKRGDTASSGTAMATVVTPQQVVEVSLNETDIAKVQVGQQATLTFDALPDLTLTGKVVSVDVIGTVTQGVVSYDVKIAFDTNNDQVKPGMSTSAAIILQAKPDVIEVPSTAVKTTGGQSYVQIVQIPESMIPNGTATLASTAIPTAPQNQMVVTGIQSDTMTEITSGLKVGDVIVIRTITGTTTATTTSNSAVRVPGLTGGTTTRAAGGNATFGR